MEYTGFEPVASTMRMLRAPNCANTPKKTNYFLDAYVIITRIAKKSRTVFFEG